MNPFQINARSMLPLILIGLTAAQPAHAYFTVIDDDLAPTIQQPQTTLPVHYTVMFQRGNRLLNSNAKYALDALLPQLRNATGIKIIGRPDATTYSKNGIPNLASNRANNIRNHLTHLGIPYNLIAIEIDNTPNPQQNGSEYPCDLYLSTQGDPQTIQYLQPTTTQQPQVKQTMLTQNFYPQAPAAPSTPLSIEIATPASPNATNPSSVTSDQIMRFIDRAVASGQMAVDVAIRIIRQLIASDPKQQQPQAQPYPYSTVSQPQQQQPQPPFILSPGNQPQTPAYSAPALRIQEWTLTPDKTLKDNLTAWAASENYHVKWNAANAYQVGRTSMLSGNLLDTVDRIATATGLSMSVSQKTHTIYIDDKPQPALAPN